MEKSNKIAFFDLETTGTSISEDRVIEISIIVTDSKLNVVDKFYSLVNPEMKISPGATKIHGFSDEDVKDAPTFREIASQVYEYMKESNISGHNIINFDVPILTRQLGECGYVVNFYDGRKVIDTYKNEIFIHPRTLKGCYEMYYGENPENRYHSAEDDVLISIDILKKQVPIIKEKGGSLQEISLDGKRPAESSTRFVWDDEGRLLYNFGKHNGKEVKDELDYLNWFLTKEMPPDTKMLLDNYVKKYS